MTLSIELIPFSERLPDWDVDKTVVSLEISDDGAIVNRFVYYAHTLDGHYGFGYEDSGLVTSDKMSNHLRGDWTHWASLSGPTQPSPAPTVVVRLEDGMSRIIVNGNEVVAMPTISLRSFVRNLAADLATALDTEVVYE